MRERNNNKIVLLERFFVENIVEDGRSFHFNNIFLHSSITCIKSLSSLPLNNCYNHKIWFPSLKKMSLEKSTKDVPWKFYSWICWWIIMMRFLWWYFVEFVGAFICKEDFEVVGLSLTDFHIKIAGSHSSTLRQNNFIDVLWCCVNAIEKCPLKSKEMWLRQNLKALNKFQF